jgi:hypothetical protein
MLRGPNTIFINLSVQANMGMPGNPPMAPDLTHYVTHDDPILDAHTPITFVHASKPSQPELKTAALKGYLGQDAQLPL